MASLIQDTILIVEDETDILELMKFNLEREGFQVLTASSGNDAMSILHDEVIDLAILDVMLPEFSGTEICRRMRSDERLGNVPVLFVTARSEENDVLHGFQSGGDDYLPKPFSPKVLLARVEALLKRSRGDRHHYISGKFEFYTNRHIVKIDGERVQLTSREFAVLGILIRNRNRTVSRNALLERGWGMETTSGPRSVDIIITRIRSKIGRYGDCIRTVTGFGYQWDEEV
jgi:two-component system alkaline phosphatase synthesis response regulator PhoP